MADSVSHSPEVIKARPLSLSLRASELMVSECDFVTLCVHMYAGHVGCDCDVCLDVCGNVCMHV